MNPDAAMPQTPVELLAAYFTLAGDVYPFGPTEVSPFTLQERAEAASKAGWKGLGFVHADILAIAGRIGLKTARQILDDHGLPHRELEFLADWYLDGERRKASDRARAELLEAAVVIGARKVKIAPGLHDTAAPDIARMSAAFARLCEEAAALGLTIVMEIMPFSNVRTIADAVAIVQGADQPNGGLLVDNWHVHRGGIAYGELANIPSRFLLAVELDDAHAQCEGSLFEDTVHHRRLCGEGCFDVPAFIERIRALGYRDYYGVEILSRTHRKLPLDEMARRSFETTMAQFEASARRGFPEFP